MPANQLIDARPRRAGERRGDPTLQRSWACLPPPRAPADLGSAGDPSPDPELDADITPEDVVAQKATGACAGPPVPFRAGLFPPAWALGAITSILKKGDPIDPNNYRGITVGHVLGKLYALVINTRLAAWLEASGKRASGQAGFRTLDNCFILRALVERARARGVKLYICAVDFEKAFDCVCRDQLWDALRRAGVGGCMLRAIQSMYAAVPVCVKSAEGLSRCFDSVLGVKQGCPLSPLQFGVLLDDLEGRLQLALGAAAALPTLAERPVPPMLFADDMLLISTSPADLQAQLDYLQSYCDAKKLTVNTGKTQVMVFKPGGGGGSVTAASDHFSYAGRQLETSRSVKYLGRRSVPVQQQLQQLHVGQDEGVAQLGQQLGQLALEPNAPGRRFIAHDWVRRVQYLQTQRAPASAFNITFPDAQALTSILELALAARNPDRQITGDSTRKVLVAGKHQSNIVISQFHRFRCIITERWSFVEECARLVVALMRRGYKHRLLVRKLWGQLRHYNGLYQTSYPRMKTLILSAVNSRLPHLQQQPGDAEGMAVNA
eukprot:scaffold2.g6887.t1